jgi:hypothetical protein
MLPREMLTCQYSCITHPELMFKFLIVNDLYEERLAVNPASTFDTLAADPLCTDIPLFRIVPNKPSEDRDEHKHEHEHERRATSDPDT